MREVSVGRGVAVGTTDLESAVQVSHPAVTLGLFRRAFARLLLS